MPHITISRWLSFDVAYDWMSGMTYWKDHLIYIYIYIYIYISRLGSLARIKNMAQSLQEDHTCLGQTKRDVARRQRVLFRRFQIYNHENMTQINTSIYLSITLSLYHSIYRSIYLSIYLSITLSFYLSIYLSIDRSIFLSVDIYI